MRGWLNLRQVGRWLKLRVPCWVKGAACGVTTDSRKDCEGSLFFGLQGERFDGSRFYKVSLQKGAVAAVVSTSTDLKKGVHKIDGRPVFCVEDANSAFAELGAAYLKTLSAKVVAITGSCGKTTTKEMMRTILRGQRVWCAASSHNNIVGVPLTILNAPSNVEVLVLEFGTNHPGEISELCHIAPPDIAVITCIAPAHIGNFGSLRALWREKTDIIRYAKKGATAIVGPVPWYHQLPHPTQGDLIRLRNPSQTVFSSVKELDGLLVLRLGGTSVHLSAYGVHFGDCAALAVVVASKLGLAPAEALCRLEGFTPPSMRMQVRRVGGILFVLDCYNANPASVKAALDWLSRRAHNRFFVFSGMAELGSFSERLHASVGRIAAKCVDLFICLGDQTEPSFSACLKSGGKALLLQKPKEVVETLLKTIKPGDTVLFKGSRIFRLEDIAALLCRQMEGEGWSGICTA